MSWCAVIKSKLKKIIPANHEYVNNELKLLNKKLEELDKISKSQEKIFREIHRTNQVQKKAIEELKKYVEQELQRRDEWGKRAAEFVRTAEGSPVWVIKCPAPEGPDKVRWGDYAYAIALKKYLDRLGIYTVVDTKEDWGCEETADVVVVLRGYYFYRPDRRNKKCIYIMWNISHPEMITSEEYELYDVVCICSRHYAKKIADQVKVPVIPLLQCTDTELFFPLEKESDIYENDYVFIGNSRGVARRCVIWAGQDKLPLKIWGGGWTEMLGDSRTMIQGTFIENDQIPDIYRSSKATLNDHWKDMLDCQFINNRIFDAIACGLPVVSDYCEELKEIFPDAILYYDTKEDFDQCIWVLENDYASIKKKVIAQWPLIKEKYSFETRARELVEIVEKYGEASK